MRRALSTFSYVEIAERRQEIGGELAARAHYYNDSLFIISSIAGNYEAGQPSVLDKQVSDSELGKTFCDHLLKFQLRSPEDAWRGKETDWPAFRVSGARSVKGFETRSYLISVRTINTAVVVSVSPRESIYGEISVQGSAGADHERLGAVIRHALKCAMTLRQHLVI